MQPNSLDLNYIAKLARLKLSPEETKSFTVDLANILQLFSVIQPINTDAIEPMAHPLELQQRLREDLITETDQHQKFQAIAPTVADDLYLVPKVIES